MSEPDKAYSDVDLDEALRSIAHAVEAFGEHVDASELRSADASSYPRGWARGAALVSTLFFWRRWRSALGGGAPRRWRLGTAARLGLVCLSLVLVVAVVVAAESGPPSRSAIATGGGDVLLALQSNSIEASSLELQAISPTTGAVIDTIPVHFRDKAIAKPTITEVTGVPGDQYAYLLFTPLNDPWPDVVARVALSGGRAQPIASFGPTTVVTDLALSPSGRTLAYTEQTYRCTSNVLCIGTPGPLPMRLVLQSTSSGHAATYPVSRFAGWFSDTVQDGRLSSDDVGALAWSPDGQHLLLVAESGTTRASLVVIDTDTLAAAVIRAAPVVGSAISSASWGAAGIFLGSRVFCPGGGCSHPANSGPKYSSKTPLVELSYPNGRLLHAFPFLTVISVAADPRNGATAVATYVVQKGGHAQVLSGSSFSVPSTTSLPAWVSRSSLRA